MWIRVKRLDFFFLCCGVCLDLIGFARSFDFPDSMRIIAGFRFWLCFGDFLEFLIVLEV